MKLGDLGASGVGWDDGYRAGVDGQDKAVDEKLLYTAGDTVSWRRPRLPQPRLDWTEAEFEFNFKLTLAIMLFYVGVPTMGGIVGKGKPSTILSMAVGMVMI